MTLEQHDNERSARPDRVHAALERLRAIDDDAILVSVVDDRASGSRVRRASPPRARATGRFGACRRS